MRVPCGAPGPRVCTVSMAQHPCLQGCADRCEQGYPLLKWGAPSHHRHHLSCTGSHWRGSTQSACGASSMLVPSLGAGESGAVQQRLWVCAGLWGLLAVSRQVCKSSVAEQGPGAPGLSLLGGAAAPSLGGEPGLPVFHAGAGHPASSLLPPLKSWHQAQPGKRLLPKWRAGGGPWPEPAAVQDPLRSCRAAMPEPASSCWAPFPAAHVCFTVL